MLGRAGDSLTLVLGIVDLTSMTGQTIRSDQIVINPRFDIVTRQNE